MKDHWHEQIQRTVNGQSSAEEIAALREALNADAELRAWYLDYMNLDAALGAAADAAVIAENATGSSETARFPRPRARLSPHFWRWLAATAACAALVVLALFPSHRDASRARPDFAAAISSTQSAIARLSVEPASVLPAWISPTASLLDQPGFPP